MSEEFKSFWLVFLGHYSTLQWDTYSDFSFKQFTNNYNKPSWSFQETIKLVNLIFLSTHLSTLINKPNHPGWYSDKYSENHSVNYPELFLPFFQTIPPIILIIPTCQSSTRGSWWLPSCSGKNHCPDHRAPHWSYPEHCSVEF